MRTVLAAAVGISFVFTGGTTEAQNSGRGSQESVLEFDRRQGDGTGRVEPNAALKKALPMMIRWPGDAGERAIASLLARGEEMVEPLRELLRRGTVREQCAAARALCLIGDRDSIPMLEDLFKDPRQKVRWSALLESVGDFDDALAQEWALEFLTWDSAGLRHAASGYLRARGDSECLEHVRKVLVEAQSDAVRLDAFRILRERSEPVLVELIADSSLGLIGHLHAPLATEVAEFLSWSRDERVHEALVKLAADDRDRAGPHAWIILSAMERQLSEELLDAALFPELIDHMRSSDPLLQAASAIAAGSIGYRVDDYRNATEDKVVPALLDIVVRGRLFPDFRLCFRHAVRTLELLTGETRGESLPAWREYWRERDGGDFVVRRELKSFNLEADPADCRVRLERADRSGRFELDTLLFGENHRAAIATEEGFEALIIPFDEMRLALAGLTELGLFTDRFRKELLENTPDSMRLRVDVQGRQRSFVVEPGPDADELVKLIDVSVQSQAWQRLLPRDTSWLQRFREEEAWFSIHPDRPERIRHTIDLALTQIEADDTDRGLRVITLLAEMAQVNRWVTESQVGRLAAVLGRLSTDDPRQRLLFDLVISTDHGKAFPAIAAALADRGLSALELLAEASQRLDAVSGALRDPRGIVRLAALEAVANSSAAYSERVIELARFDIDLQVRTKALEILARTGATEGLELLLERSADPDPQVRQRSLRALGFSSDDRAAERLTEAVHNESEVNVAFAAVEGLSRLGTTRAARALHGAAMRFGGEHTIGRLAVRALRGMNATTALPVLRELAESEDAALAREVSYARADFGDMEVVPVLLGDLENERWHDRSRRVLTTLFCRDFPTETWRYRSLFEGTPDFTQTDHFRQVLRESGVDVPDGTDFLERDQQPTLLDALADNRWYVRRVALSLLEQATGQYHGELSVSASERDINEMVRRWRAALEGQAKR